MLKRDDDSAAAATAEQAPPTTPQVPITTPPVDTSAQAGYGAYSSWYQVGLSLLLNCWLNICRLQITLI